MGWLVEVTVRASVGDPNSTPKVMGAWLLHRALMVSAPMSMTAPTSGPRSRRYWLAAVMGSVVVTPWDGERRGSAAPTAAATAPSQSRWRRWPARNADPAAVMPAGEQQQADQHADDQWGDGSAVAGGRRPGGRVLVTRLAVALEGWRGGGGCHGPSRKSPTCMVKIPVMVLLLPVITVGTPGSVTMAITQMS